MHVFSCAEQKKQKLTRRSLIYDSENGPSDEKLAAKRESCASSQCQTKRILNNLKSEVPVPFISLKNFIYYSGHTLLLTPVDDVPVMTAAAVFADSNQEFTCKLYVDPNSTAPFVFTLIDVGKKSLAKRQDSSVTTDISTTLKEAKKKFKKGKTTIVHVDVPVSFLKCYTFPGHGLAVRIPSDVTQGIPSPSLDLEVFRKGYEERLNEVDAAGSIPVDLPLRLQLE
ncbi:hypothetical protein Tco_0595758 [Tanacetum coccineum]